MESLRPSEIDNSCPIDLGLMKTRYGNGAEPILAMFKETLPIEMKRLDAALERGERKQIRDLVHGIKGICGTVFAEPMRSTCAEIESLIRASDWQAIPPLIEQLNHMAGQVLSQLGHRVNSETNSDNGCRRSSDDAR